MNRYQIKDWSKHFENDRSRTRKHCNFVCVPNKQHGMGFSRIMAEKDGAMIYGIWHMILGACSQQTNRDGWLTEDGEQTGSAWGVDDLSLKFRRPESEIKRALEFLASEKVGWVIIHKTNDLLSDNHQHTAHQPTTHLSVTADSPTTHLEGKGIEEKEEKGKTPSVSRQINKIFDDWNAMAEKTGIPRCLLVSDERRRSFQARLKEPFFSENWETALEKISKSNFCRGQNEKGWFATLDWFIKPGKVVKIIEGAYDNREQKQRPNHIPDAVVKTDGGGFEVIP